MAQQLLDGLQQCVRDDLRTIIRKELENEKKVTDATVATEALWPVHELKATVQLTPTSNGVKIFDLIPGLTASANEKTSWVGLKLPKDPTPSLHGDLTWHVTINRKDGTATEKTTVSGKLNCGRFFVKTDELAVSWGTAFKKENWDSITNIIVEVHFKRNNEEKRTKWKTVQEHDTAE
jgi:hypothetical protein